MVDGVLVEEPALQETADHPQCNTPFAEVGKGPAVICIPERQDERFRRLILPCFRHLPGGRIPRPPVEGQQILASGKAFPQKRRRKSMASPPVFSEYRHQVRRSLIRRLSISAVVWYLPIRRT